MGKASHGQASDVPSKKNKLKQFLQRILQEILKKNNMPGLWVIRASDPSNQRIMLKIVGFLVLASAALVFMRWNMVCTTPLSRWEDPLRLDLSPPVTDARMEKKNICIPSQDLDFYFYTKKQSSEVYFVQQITEVEKSYNPKVSSASSSGTG